MRHFVLTIAIIALISVVAVQAQYYANYIGNDGYSGYDGATRRFDDPYSRERYFGQDYVKPFVNFGQKGPTDRLLNTGSKSAYSGVFNFDTNAYSNRGRDPSRISNFDPGMRGYARQDTTVELSPFGATNANGEPIVGKGTARIVSTGLQQYSQNDYSDFKTQVFLQTQNLPPLADGEVYEAWVFDDETEYAMSMGVFTTSFKLTHQLLFEIQRSLIDFDAVMITREPYLDSDPRPGEILLYGNVEKSRENLAVRTSVIPQRIR